MHRMSVRLCLLAAAAAVLVAAVPALANTSHAGWPRIDGALLMNKQDQSRPLDMRVGADPFGGVDGAYRCDGAHENQSCLARVARCEHHVGGRNGCRRFTVTPHGRHNELLGGHGNDQIFAGPNGDVIWGDYKPSGQPTTQRDLLVGGAGRDVIYASHGVNDIRAGAGNDWIKAHFGRGRIDCGGGRDLLYVSRRAQKRYTTTRCERISHKTLGY